MRERITNTRPRISTTSPPTHPTPIHTRFFAQHARHSFFFCSFTPFFTATGRDFLSNNGQSIHQPIATTPLSIRTRPCSKHSFPHFSVVNAGRSTPSRPLSTLTLQHHLTVIALHTTQTPITNTHFIQPETAYSINPSSKTHFQSPCDDSSRSTDRPAPPPPDSSGPSTPNPPLGNTHSPA